MTELNDILSNLSLNDDNSSSNPDTNLDTNPDTNPDTNSITIWEHILNTMKYKGIGEKIITSNDITPLDI